MDSMNEEILYELVKFSQYHALNDFTREKQAIIRHFLETECQPLKKVQENCEQKLNIEAYWHIFMPVKQIRRAEVFLTRKQEAKKGNIPTVGTEVLPTLTQKAQAVFLKRLESRRL